MSQPNVVLVAHGTRSTRGVALVAELAEEVSRLVGPTRVAFVDVLGPSVSQVLRRLRAQDAAAVVVPAFLAAGYHVRTDVPNEIAASEHPAVQLARALGPDPILAEVLLERLRASGWRPGDAVVLAAAGSSDARALRDVWRMSAMLSELVGRRVAVGYVATATPKVDDVVAGLREAGERRVFIASYLMSHGLFHGRLGAAGADGVAQPLGAHPGLVRLVASRYSEARSALTVCADARRGGVAART